MSDEIKERPPFREVLPKEVREMFEWADWVMLERCGLRDEQSAPTTKRQSALQLWRMKYET